jgi:hypothetical protein
MLIPSDDPCAETVHQKCAETVPLMYGETAHKGYPSKDTQFTAAKAGSELGEQSTKDRGAQKPGAVAPASDPSRLSKEEMRKRGVYDRDNTGQPDRPEPLRWRLRFAEAHPGREWFELTPAEQCECWRIIDHSDPAADYEGWPAHVAAGGA